MYSRYIIVHIQFSSSTDSVRTSALYFFESFRVVGWWLVRHCRLRQRRTVVIEMSSEYCFSFLVQCIIVSSTLLGGTVLHVHGGGGGGRNSSSSSSNGDRRNASFVWRRVVISIVWMALLLLRLLLRYPPFGQSSLLYPVFEFHIPDVGM